MLSRTVTSRGQVRGPGPFSRTTATLAAATLALSLGVACQKKGGGTAAGPAGSAVSALPKDTGFVAGVSVSKLKGTKLWKTIEEQAMKEGKADLEKFKTACGLDPMTDIESVIVAGGQNFDDETKILFAVRGKWTEDKLNKCIEGVAKSEGKDVKVTKTGAVTEYSQASGNLYAHWVAADTAVFGTDKARVEEVASKKTSLKDNATLSALLGKVDTGSTLWAAAEIPQTGDTADMMGGLGTSEKPQGAYANLAYAKDLNATIGLRFPSEKGAKEVVDKANAEVGNMKSQPMIGDYLKTLKIEGKGSDAVVSLTLTEQQLDQLSALVASQLGPMMMMMGGDMGGGGMEPPPGGEAPPPGGEAPPPGGEAPPPGGEAPPPADEPATP